MPSSLIQLVVLLAGAISSNANRCSCIFQFEVEVEYAAPIRCIGCAYSNPVDLSNGRYSREIVLPPPLELF